MSKKIARKNLHQSILCVFRGGLDPMLVNVVCAWFGYVHLRASEDVYFGFRFHRGTTPPAGLQTSITRILFDMDGSLALPLEAFFDKLLSELTKLPTGFNLSTVTFVPA